MDEDNRLEVAGEDWGQIYKCKKCGWESETVALAFQMFDKQGILTYEKQYCLKCYMFFWEKQGLGELEAVTIKPSDESTLQ